MIRKLRGFTLIETLMALMIFSFVVIGYLMIMGQTNRIQGNLMQQRTAMMLAQNLIEEIRLADRLEPGDKNGEFPGIYASYRWRSHIEEHEEIPHLFEVTVQVIWNEQETSADDYQLQTMIANFPATQGGAS